MSCRCCVNAVVGVGLLTYFVFQCIALAHSDTEEFYSACGHTLRDLVMACVVLNCFGTIFSFGVMLCVKQSNGLACVIFGTVLLILYGILLLLLKSLMTKESVAALSNSDCSSMMRNTTGGINSISANTGSPLLACVGIVDGTLFFSAVLFYVLKEVIKCICQ